MGVPTKHLKDEPSCTCVTAAQEDAGGAGAEQLLLLLLLQLEALVAVARELPLCEGVGGGGKHHVIRAADVVRCSCPLK